MCLDVMRMLGKKPGILAMLCNEFEKVKKRNQYVDNHWSQIQQRLHQLQERWRESLLSS